MTARLCLVLALAACAGTGAPTGAADNAVPDRHEPRTETVLVVVPRSDDGKSAVRGAEIAAAAANERGGIDGVPIELVVLDERSDAAALRDRLASGDPPLAVIGGLDADATSALATMVREHGDVPVISLSRELIETDHSTFAMVPNVRHRGHAAGTFAATAARSGMIADVRGAATPATRRALRFYRKGALEGLAAAGAIVTSRGAYRDVSSIARVIAQLLASTQDALLVLDEPAAGLAFVEEARRNGVTTPAVVGPDWDPDLVSAAAGVGDVYVPVLFTPVAPGAEPFVAAFRTAFETEPEIVAALAHDAIRVIERLRTDRQLHHLDLTDEPGFATGNFRYDHGNVPVGKMIGVVLVSGGTVSHAGQVRTP